MKIWWLGLLAILLLSPTWLSGCAIKNPNELIVLAERHGIPSTDFYMSENGRNASPKGVGRLLTGSFRRDKPVRCRLQALLDPFRLSSRHSHTSRYTTRLHCRIGRIVRTRFSFFAPQALFPKYSGSTMRNHPSLRCQKGKGLLFQPCMRIPTPPRWVNDSRSLKNQLHRRTRYIPYQARHLCCGHCNIAPRQTMKRYQQDVLHRLKKTTGLTP